MAKCKQCNGTGLVLLTSKERAAIRRKIAENEALIAAMKAELKKARRELMPTAMANAREH